MMVLVRDTAEILKNTLHKMDTLQMIRLPLPVKLPLPMKFLDIDRKEGGGCLA